MSIVLTPEQQAEAAAGFQRLQAKAFELTFLLGGHQFAQCVVVKNAASLLDNLMRDRIDREKSWAVSRHFMFSSYLVATAGDFDAAIAQMERRFLRLEGEESATGASAEIFGGRLVLRGLDLWFETDRAHVLMAHAFQDGRQNKWQISIRDKAAEVFFDLTGRHRPSVGTVHAKTQEAAVKSLQRMASDVFLAPLDVPAEDLGRMILADIKAVMRDNLRPFDQSAPEQAHG